MRIITVLVDYDKWRKMAVKDQDRESVGDFYGVSMDILSKSIHIQQAVSVPEENTKFSITPKKIKIVSTFFKALKKKIYIYIIAIRYFRAKTNLSSYYQNH